MVASARDPEELALFLDPSVLLKNPLNGGLSTLDGRLLLLLDISQIRKLLLQGLYLVRVCLLLLGLLVLTLSRLLPLALPRLYLVLKPLKLCLTLHSFFLQLLEQPSVLLQSGLLGRDLGSDFLGIPLALFCADLVLISPRLQVLDPLFD